MSMRRALQWVFAISLFGVAFSGTLSYREVFGASAAACVYGFFMYLVLAAISGGGLWSARHSLIGESLG